MIELNGFALLDKKEIELITGKDKDRFFWLPLHSLNYEEILKIQNLVRKNKYLRNKPEQVLRKQKNAAFDTKEKALLCSMLFDICTDERWEENLRFINDSAKENIQKKTRSVTASSGEALYLDKEMLKWIKNFSQKVHNSLSNQERKELGNLFQGLSNIYAEKYEKILQQLSFFSSIKEGNDKDTSPFASKGYYKAKTDSRGRIIANGKGEILLEYIQPIAPIPVSQYILKFFGTKPEKARSAQNTVRFLHSFDLFCGEVVGGLNNFFDNYLAAVSNKEIKDPYAKAFAILYWTLKDFLESRTGNYSSIKEKLIFNYKIKKILYEFLKEKNSFFKKEIEEIESKESKHLEIISQNLNRLKIIPSKLLFDLAKNNEVIKKEKSYEK
ncbi:conserved hypothetical protein [Methylacidiphilum fumariolicum SolV]|uniref:Uncharacterized protein n=1 Tax=Methylacidiphilum fumariolicum (strain SolV) TaxID=1156937 RepID=I0JVA2_METFB|nr:hypothetical protein [Candidatus Methylacidiphilum fumarolicum]CCG91171.1 conserved hypothetical protein [Methylacidiphilum fumariolicum SolV]